MTPIGSTSSNIRRAIEFIVYSSCCRAGAFCGYSRSLGRSRAAKLIAQRRLTAQEDDQHAAAAQGTGTGHGRDGAPGALTGTARSLKPASSAACPTPLPRPARVAVGYRPRHSRPGLRAAHQVLFRGVVLVQVTTIRDEGPSCDCQRDHADGPRGRTQHTMALDSSLSTAPLGTPA